MKLLDDNNPLVKFLIFYGAKKKVRRKYVEFKLKDYSITQTYDSNTILIRKHIGLSKKQMYSNFTYVDGSRAYRVHYANTDVNIILEKLKEYLKENNKFRKLKIKKILK